MVIFAIFFALGNWLLQQQAVLPQLQWAFLPVVMLFLLVLAARFSRFKPARPLLLAALALVCGFFHATLLATQRLSDELPAEWQGRDIAVIGVVAEMPRQHERGLGFGFDVEKVQTDHASVPRHILLSTYANQNVAPPDLHAGERWQLTVRLKQPHGTANPHAFDFEAWALERNLRAQGYVNSRGDNRLLDTNAGGFAYLVEQWRESIRNRFQRKAGSAPYIGVLGALAIGDQAAIPASQWQTFTRTGVNHLMSISGLHITMLAGLVFMLAYAVWRRIPQLSLHLPAYKIATLAGLLTAIVYALLSGYGIPAQRTVCMLGTIAAGLWWSRGIFPSQLLAAALFMVILLDPWAVNAPGFWLSFAAVALIFYITANRLGKRHWAIEFGRIQWAMTIGLVPLLLAMFQQISLVSPLANAFAIPLVSFIVVPLTLLAAVPAFDWLIFPAHLAMQLVMVMLEWLNNLPVAVWVQHAPPAWTIVAGMLGIAWLFLPRGFPARGVGGILLLPMFLMVPAQPQPGEVRLTIFDVGQGLAVAVQTHAHNLLYDSGPQYNSESNSGNRILVPSMRGMGIAKLDSLILTHDDADHTGGAMSVLQAIPAGSLVSSLPVDSPILQAAPVSIPCIDGQSWVWDQVSFEILHPGKSSYADESLKTNDMGCVLRISTGDISVLLTADIEKKSEQRIVSLNRNKLAATLLVVPHHGSKTSSTPEFVKAVHPRYAVFTAGYRNSFGHPRPEIIQRYVATGSKILRSDRDGAILVHMDTRKLKIEKYRQTHGHYWQQAVEMAE